MSLPLPYRQAEQIKKYGVAGFGRRMNEMKSAGTRAHTHIERLLQHAPEVREGKLKLDEVRDEGIKVSFLLYSFCLGTLIVLVAGISQEHRDNIARLRSTLSYRKEALPSACFLQGNL